MTAPTTLAEVKRRNRAAGFHFFEAGTMRFFNSKVETGVYGRGYFVTSETPDHDVPRLYTVRLARETGECQTVGKFRGFPTLADAVAAARRCAEDRAPEVRFEPYDDAAATEDETEHFHWWTYVGGLPVDVRTTLEKAEAIAAEIRGEVVA